MVAVKLPDIMSGSITFENILSIRVLEWLVILVRPVVCIALCLSHANSYHFDLAGINFTSFFSFFISDMYTLSSDPLSLSPIGQTVRLQTIYCLLCVPPTI